MNSKLMNLRDERGLMAPEDWDSIEQNVQLDMNNHGDDDVVSKDPMNDEREVFLREEGDYGANKADDNIAWQKIVVNEGKEEKGEGFPPIDFAMEPGDSKRKTQVDSIPEVLVLNSTKVRDKRIGTKVLCLGWIMVVISSICSTLSALLYDYKDTFTAVAGFIVVSHWIGSTAVVVSASVPVKASNYDMIYLEDSKRPERITLVRTVHFLLWLVLLFSSYLYFSVPPFFQGVILFLITIAFVKPQLKYSEYFSCLGIKHPFIPLLTDTISGKLAVVPLLGGILFVVSTGWNISSRDGYREACVINKEWLCSESYWDYESAPVWMLVLDFMVYLFGLCYMIYTMYCACSECSELVESSSHEKVHAKAAKLLMQMATFYVRIFSIALTFWGLTYYEHVKPRELGISIIISGLSSFTMQALFIIFGRKARYAKVSAFIIYMENVLETLGLQSAEGEDEGEGKATSATDVERPRQL